MMAMDLEALAIEVRAREGEGGMEPEAHTRDGREGHGVVEGGGGRQEAPDFLHTPHGGETVGGWRAQERSGVPVALEDMLGEDAEAAGAEAPGRGGEAVDVFPGQEVTLQRLFGEQGGRCAMALSEQAYCTDRGLWGPLARATAWQCGNHGLTQWGHAISPCVR